MPQEPPIGAHREYSALLSWRVQNSPFWNTSIGAAKMAVLQTLPHNAVTRTNAISNARMRTNLVHRPDLLARPRHVPTQRPPQRGSRQSSAAPRKRASPDLPLTIYGPIELTSDYSFRCRVSCSPESAHVRPDAARLLYSTAVRWESFQNAQEFCHYGVIRQVWSSGWLPAGDASK
jgi:hypothetical protein